MHHVVELVPATAWPMTTLTIVLLLRSELQRSAGAFAERIQSANSIVVGRRGIEIKGIVDPVGISLQQRRLNFRRFINSVNLKSDLDCICDALEIEKSPSIRKEQAKIVLEFGRIVTTVEEMDALSLRLKSITGRDF